MKASLLSLLLIFFLFTFIQGQEPKRDTSAPKGGWVVPSAEELKKVERPYPLNCQLSPRVTANFWFTALAMVLNITPA